MAKVPTLTMNDGNKIPILGLGTYALDFDLSEGATVPLGGTPGTKSGSDKKTTEGVCLKSVEAALSCGYKHIDTAAFYNNEEEVGQGINNSIDKGVITREELFLTTKLWCDKHEYDQVVPALQNSLKKLNQTYVDLYLIHWPLALKDDGSSSDVDYLDTWKAMEKCKELGLAKSIGVSNFNIQQLERLLKNSKTVPVVNQIEVNPNLTQKKLHEYCASKNIIVTAYTPLGSMPEMRDTTNAPPAPRMNDPILTAMGKKYNKSTIQIVLRYLIERGIVAIPKSFTPAKIVQNLDIFDFSLTPEEVQKIDEFDADYRVVLVPYWKNFANYPF